MLWPIPPPPAAAELLAAAAEPVGDAIPLIMWLMLLMPPMSMAAWS